MLVQLALTELRKRENDNYLGKEKYWSITKQGRTWFSNSINHAVQQHRWPVQNMFQAAIWKDNGTYCDFKGCWGDHC